MRTSLILSAFLHLLLLVVVLINFSSSRKPVPAPQPVAVEILSPSDISRAKAGSQDKQEASAPPKTTSEEKRTEAHATAPDPKPVEKPAKKQAVLPPPSKPKTAVADPPVKREPPQEKAAEAVPEPAPPVKRAEPKPDKAAEAERKPKPEPEREAKRPPPQRDRIASLLNQPPEEESRDDPRAENKTKFDPNRIAALLNRDPTAGQQPREQGPKEPWHRPSSLQDQATGMTPAAPGRTAYGQPTGHDDRMSTNEVDAFIAQISRCWTPPVGGLGSDAIVVKLHIELNEDGTLSRQPQVVNSVSSPFFTPAADSAVRAVLQCQPYRLPQEKFGQWRDMMLNFDPREMYGG